MFVLKRKLTIIIAFLLLSLTPLSVGYAHSGGTDENGGHYDHSTGEYHYHHGYPAHQHPDGKCPYDFDDKTGENTRDYSSGGTRSAASSEPKRASIPEEESFFAKLFNITLLSALLDLIICGLLYWLLCFIADTKFSAARYLDTRRFFILFGMLAPLAVYWGAKQFVFVFNWRTFSLSLLFSIPSFIYSIYILVDSRKKQLERDLQYQEEKRKIEEEEQRRREDEQRRREAAIAEEKRKFEEEAQRYRDIYAGKDMLVLCGAPPGAFVDQDEMPHQIIDGEDLFDVRISSNGKVFHRPVPDTHVCASAYKHVNYCQVFKLPPCRRCKPPIPDISWFTEYLRIKEIKEKYNIQ